MGLKDRKTDILVKCRDTFKVYMYSEKAQKI